MDVETVPSTLQSVADTKNIAACDRETPREKDGDLPCTQDKVDILFKATGNAPILKKKKWRVEQDKQIGNINEFLKKYLNLDPLENLFLYVNQSFSPSPDEIIRNLYDCFGSDGKLVIYYCKNPAWG